MRTESAIIPHMGNAANAIPEKRRTTEENFQGREMHGLALFSFNEFGFRESAKIAFEYVSRAMEALEEAARLNRKTKKTANELRERAKRIQSDCEYLARYCESREKLKRTPTSTAVEWTTKQAVRAISRGDITHFHNLLAYQIRRFHSEVSAILNEVTESNLSFGGK